MVGTRYWLVLSAYVGDKLYNYYRRVSLEALSAVPWREMIEGEEFACI